ncbi:MAG TPA: SDR family oxidoreductase [Mycobacterium sp.]|nr:SDR family oxidoreductase [Mycobacterium sp.]
MTDEPQLSRRAMMTAGAIGATGALVLGGAAACAQGSPSGELAGKAALVTGARNNMGRGFAVALAEMGADVFVHHHKPETRDQAEETARLCHEHGARTSIFTGDLGNSATVRAMYDAAFDAFGRLDIAVNVAGRNLKAPMAQISEDEFERCLAINTRGMFYSMQQAAQRIADQGRIINIATSLLAAMTPLYGGYAGTKAPIEIFTRTLARELGERGVTVNAVAPGPVDTPFYHGPESPEAKARVINAVPARRLGVVGDIVPLVAFLASPRSQWISGQTLWINGAYDTR